MKILGIETSCDETAAAIVQDGTRIISNVISSSQEMHKKTGGIIPEQAAREQIKYMIPVLNEALTYKTNNLPRRQAGEEQKTTEINNKKLLSVICDLISDIDAIAVTVGPGLIGSLLVGVETAKTIAIVTRKPIIPVNHIFAHIYSNFLNHDRYFNNLNYQSTIQFPAIALVVSGGHTELFLMRSVKKLKWIGGTRDDAAGEAFDKTARLLGLGYPGGPAIAAAAAEYRITNHESRIRKKELTIQLPRPMMGGKNSDFSFSGLKTAVLRETNKLKAAKNLNNQTIQQLANEMQESITDVLVKKTIQAVQQYNVKSIILGGGVAANKRLTEKFNSEIRNSKLSRRLRDPVEAGEISFYVPPPSLCTDNAAAIASFAYFHYKPVPWNHIQAQPDLEVEV